MSLSRFYLPADQWGPEGLTLTGDEAQHCARVLRHHAGDGIEIFDGNGKVATGEITAITKTEVRARILSVQQHAPLPGAIHLLPALIKAEPFEWLLEKAVELGAASIQPVLTHRTVVHLDAAQLEKKLPKWQRLMLESAKQCHTPFLPRLHAPRPLAGVLAETPAGALKLIPALSEHTRSLHEVLATHALHAREAYVVIGPEGDFTAEEEALAREQGFQAITLGPLVLRAETAGIAMLAVLGHEFRRAI
jgi:16S rRNA (uracil1498-N3)-methyltransferase